MEGRGLRLLLVPPDDVRAGDFLVDCDTHRVTGKIEMTTWTIEDVNWKMVWREEAPEPLERQKIGRFVPPTLEEITSEITRLGYDIDAVKFKAFYDANGWVQKGGTPIRNWKASVVTWARLSIERGYRTGRLAAPPPGEVATRTWHDKDAPGWIVEAGKKLAAPPSVDRKDYQPNGRLYVSPKRQIAFGRWISGENIKDPG